MSERGEVEVVEESAWLAEERHARLRRRPIPLSRVARLARGAKVLGSGPATARTREDVVERKIESSSLPPTVLAAKAIAHQDLGSKRPRVAPLPHVDVCDEANDGRAWEGTPLRAEDAIPVELDGLGGSSPHEPHRARNGHDAERLVGGIEKKNFSREEHWSGLLSTVGVETNEARGGSRTRVFRFCRSVARRSPSRALSMECGERDSNPHIEFGRLASCRWTITALRGPESPRRGVRRTEEGSPVVRSPALREVVREPGAGVEPATSRLRVGCSFQLSYAGKASEPGRTRTCDLSGRNRVLSIRLSYRSVREGRPAGVEPATSRLTSERSFR